MIRRLLAAALTIVVAGALLVACWPQLFGVERVIGVAQVVSIRGMLALVAVLSAALLGIFAVLSAAARRFFATLATMLVVFALVSTAVLGVRGFGTPSAESDDGDLVVLSWNTLGDAPGSDAIAALALDEGADIVSLPETSEDAAAAVAARMAASGREMQVLGVQFDAISKARSTRLLISADLGGYRLDDSVGSTTTLPSVVAVPVDGSGPTIIAAHPVAPVPSEMGNWRAGLDWLAERCADPASDVIVAGDLNSTLDHWGSLGSDAGIASCDDAARTVGAAAVGTWPASVPPLLGTPIDHVLSTGAWQAVDFQVIESMDSAGSDHRPIVARLRPAD
ncbi:endonuclease/exonuclease/phosphatase family protein [Homoserinibacter sp. GY 40078]|uniref:endonuclease/exonuclease/phosphatase family protein n=1 Tax=Homoserinibacter sp. GY 40078 TaxID=2603275 RepID=UPI0011C9C3BE|nr:endonuclease/exonuclease/phosphatase family protein [Homoserinibacter sp. GY 40078]TXK19614.1 endonuclease/exonuclease/phosphatase family protein [Homoserinibacter sp. GY 40078]